MSSERPTPKSASLTTPYLRGRVRHEHVRAGLSCEDRSFAWQRGRPHSSSSTFAGLMSRCRMVRLEMHKRSSHLRRHSCSLPCAQSRCVASGSETAGRRYLRDAAPCVGLLDLPARGSHSGAADRPAACARTHISRAASAKSVAALANAVTSGRGGTAALLQPTPRPAPPRPAQTRACLCVRKRGECLRAHAPTCVYARASVRHTVPSCVRCFLSMHAP